VIGTEDPFPDGQQRGEPVPGTDHIPRLTHRVGNVATGAQGFRVLGTVGLIRYESSPFTH